MTHAVIFDIDGTLLNSSSEDEEIYKKAVERVLGAVTFRSGLADYDHITDSGILLQVLDDNSVPRDDAVIADIKNVFFRMIENYIATSGPFQEIPGAGELVRQLRQSKCHGIAIATGGWRQSARTKLTTAGFDIDGVPLATSDDAIDRTDIMRIALASTGSSHESVTYFGDGPWDRQACERLGWTFRPVGPAVNGLSSFDGVAAELDI